MLSEQIKKHRERLGFTQTELAKRAGLSVASISMYESGKNSPRMGQLARIAHAIFGTKKDPRLLGGRLPKARGSFSPFAMKKAPHGSSRK